MPTEDNLYYSPQRTQRTQRIIKLKELEENDILNSICENDRIPTPFNINNVFSMYSVLSMVYELKIIKKRTEFWYSTFL
jgi:hypothetical protein